MSSSLVTRPQSGPLDLEHELGVALGLAHLLHEQLQRLLRLECVQHPAQLPDDLELIGGQQDLFLTGARRAHVDRREEPLLRELAAQPQLHVAGALELLEDNLVHPGTGLDQGGRQDGQRAAVLDVARRAEEPLGRVQRGRVDTTGQDAAAGGRRVVVGPPQPGDVVEQDDHIVAHLHQPLRPLDGPPGPRGAGVRGPRSTGVRLSSRKPTSWPISTSRFARSMASSATVVWSSAGWSNVEWMTSPFTVRCMSVTSSGRSSTRTTMRWHSGLFLVIALAIDCRIIVLPAFGGDTIKPRWPLPIGQIRSMIRVVMLPASVSSLSLSCGYSGVSLANSGRPMDFSGSSPFTLSSRTSALNFSLRSPSCGLSSPS